MVKEEARSERMRKRDEGRASELVSKASFLAWLARTQARPSIRPEACIGLRRMDCDSAFATVTKGFYDVL